MRVELRRRLKSNKIGALRLAAIEVLTARGCARYGGAAPSLLASTVPLLALSCLIATRAEI